MQIFATILVLALVGFMVLSGGSLDSSLAVAPIWVVFSRREYTAGWVQARRMIQSIPLAPSATRHSSLGRVADQVHPEYLMPKPAASRVRQQASVHRFRYPDAKRREVALGLLKACVIAACTLGVLVASGAVNPVLNAIGATMLVVGAADGAGRYARLRRMGTTIEVGPFCIIEIDRRGRRLMTLWDRRLSLCVRSPEGCIDIIVPGRRAPVRIDRELQGFSTALGLIIEYGRFWRRTLSE